MEKTINFRISEELKVELQFIAEEKEIKVSSLVREVITDYLEDYYSQEVKLHTVVLPNPANYNYNQ